MNHFILFTPKFSLSSSVDPSNCWTGALDNPYAREAWLLLSPLKSICRIFYLKDWSRTRDQPKKAPGTRVKIGLFLGRGMVPEISEFPVSQCLFGFSASQGPGMN